MLPQDSSRKSLSPSPERLPATRNCAPWATPATTCTTAATTSTTWPRHCEYEEVAYLLHPRQAAQHRGADRLQGTLVHLRSLPAAVKAGAGASAAFHASHGRAAHQPYRCWAACVPRAADHNEDAACQIADSLLACLGSMLLYWHHFARNGRRIEVEADGDSIAAHFLYLLHGHEPSAGVGRGHAGFADPLRRA